MAEFKKPKKFKTGKELIQLWADFCDQIRENGYIEAPTQTAFCRWLTREYDGCDRKTIYTALNKYFPDIKKEFETIRADTIAEGTMLCKYQPTMSIFALKNWCRWTDKADVTVERKEGQLADLIEGLKEDDLYPETATPDEAMADE
jgi:hypothetical protein